MRVANINNPSISRVQIVDGDETTHPSGTVTFDNILMTSSIELVLAQITESDAGEYHCQALFESTLIESDAATIAVYGVY